MVKSETLCRSTLSKLYPMLSDKSVEGTVEILRRYNLEKLSELGFSYLVASLGCVINRIQSAEISGHVDLKGEMVTLLEEIFEEVEKLAGGDGG